MWALSQIGQNPVKPRGDKSIYKNSKRNKVRLSSGIVKKKKGGAKANLNIPEISVKKKKGGKWAGL